ncbi:hypothetical protein [Frankia sp. AgKG'84/4]|uniref:hypothetical protein n=1 Tax=Frankia sp. AgKG'84/4 TaxID=573490 RepID=UPI00200D7C8B|nr:hypothetical protein [Frankia sp. AgKG'84/4]MCL9792811.1 hypothetical protein [Frankia sp. AgKG'84/4]
MSPWDWQEIIGTIGFFLLIATVITVSIWQLAATRRAKVGMAREGEYRTIADKGVLVHEAIERQLAELGGRLAEMHSRLHALERVLKEVD